MRLVLDIYIFHFDLSSEVRFTLPPSYLVQLYGCLSLKLNKTLFFSSFALAQSSSLWVSGKSIHPIAQHKHLGLVFHSLIHHPCLSRSSVCLQILKQNLNFLSVSLLLLGLSHYPLLSGPLQCPGPLFLFSPPTTHSPPKSQSDSLKPQVRFYYRVASRPTQSTSLDPYPGLWGAGWSSPGFPSPQRVSPTLTF